MVQLTDAAFSIDSVARVDVFVLRIDGRVADADSTAAARGATADSSKVTGWTTLATPNQSINLLAFQAGLTFPAGQAVVPAGSYRSPYFLGQANTDRRKWIAASIVTNIGGFLSGNQVSLSPTLTIRRGGRLTSSLRWTRNDIDLPQGSFVTNLATARLTYNFSTLINASTLLQYNDRTHRWSTNVRFNWLRTAASGLYVVYNDTEAFSGLGPVSRAFVIKYGHVFDVLH